MVLLGIDRLKEYDGLFAGRRIGLITNYSGVDSRLIDDMTVFHQLGYRVVKLFTPEHGMYGAMDGAGVDDCAHPVYHTPMISLYGGKLKTLGDTLYYAAFDAEESYAGTASALMLASILGREDADALARYLLESSSASTAPNFALMVYVRAYQMTVSHSAFTCRIDGETKTYDFGDIERGVVVLEFGDKALDYADFRVTRGKVSYFAIYSATLGENEQSAGVLASVSLTPDHVDAGVNETLDLTVSLNVAQQCLDDTFIIDLVLPAGVRYSGFEDHWDGSYYLISNEKGRLRFVVTRWNRESNPNARSAFSVSFRVHTTTVLPGSFVLEEPVVQLPASNLMAYGARGAIEIR